MLNAEGGGRESDFFIYRSDRVTTQLMVPVRD
jgi:hypothetical protein